MNSINPVEPKLAQSMTNKEIPIKEVNQQVPSAQSQPLISPSPDHSQQAALTAHVSVNEIAPIQMMAGTDWIAVLGFAIAALSFLVTVVIIRLSTNATMKSTSELVRSQEDTARANRCESRELARVQMIAGNRQAWINTLRLDLAEYMSVISEIWQLHLLNEGRRSALKDDYSTEEGRQWAYSYKLARQNAERLKAKINLLLNPVEGASIELLATLNAALDLAIQGKNVNLANKDIIQKAQTILKEEWERVKMME